MCWPVRGGSRPEAVAGSLCMARPNAAVLRSQYELRDSRPKYHEQNCASQGYPVTSELDAVRSSTNSLSQC